MIPRYKQRLTAAMRGGNLTVTDLARWFGTKRPIMSLWARGKADPLPCKEGQLSMALIALETIIEDGRRLPIPLTVSRSERAEYIDQLKANISASVSKSGPPPRRRKVLVRP